MGTTSVPILGDPEYLDTALMRRTQWTGDRAAGRKCHLTKVPCHSNLERQFADFLDGARDVDRYVKNERFGFSVTYYENGRPRQYYPDFVVAVRDGAREVLWIAETKGEVWSNTAVKRQAAEAWCQKVSSVGGDFGTWRYLFVKQQPSLHAVSAGTKTFGDLVRAISLG